MVQADAIILSRDNPLNHGWISLTSDPQPTGHGLPDGRQITSEQARHLPHFKQGGAMYCHDHTAVRLTIELDPADPQLVRATDHHPSDHLLAMEIAAYNPTYAELPTALISNTLKDLTNGSLLGKSSTWWYYMAPIPLARVVATEVRDTNGSYVPISR